MGGKTRTRQQANTFGGYAKAHGKYTDWAKIINNGRQPPGGGLRARLASKLRLFMQHPGFSVKRLVSKPAYALNPKTRFGRWLARKARSGAMALTYSLEEIQVAEAGHTAVHNLLAEMGAGKKPLSVASIAAGDLSHEIWFKREFKQIEMRASEKSWLMRFRGRVERRVMRERKGDTPKEDIPLHKGTFEQPNLPERSFDFVYSLDALHWLASVERGETVKQARKRTTQALKNMAGLLKEGSSGRLLVTYRPDYRRKAQEKGLFRVLQPGEIEAIFSEAGLNLLKSETLVDDREAIGGRYLLFLACREQN